MLAVAFVALAADNYLSLQPEMQEVIKGDPRNNGFGPIQPLYSCLRSEGGWTDEQHG
jgi:hypothetical protein